MLNVISVSSDQISKVFFFFVCSRGARRAESLSYKKKICNFLLSEKHGIQIKQYSVMDNVLIYLEKPVFQHGQLYVALSRGRRKENVKVFLKNAPFAKNIVNTNVLN